MELQQKLENHLKVYIKPEGIDLPEKYMVVARNRLHQNVKKSNEE